MINGPVSVRMNPIPAFIIHATRSGTVSMDRIPFPLPGPTTHPPQPIGGESPDRVFVNLSILSQRYDDPMIVIVNGRIVHRSSNIDPIGSPSLPPPMITSVTNIPDRDPGFWWPILILFDHPDDLRQRAFIAGSTTRTFQLVHDSYREIHPLTHEPRTGYDSQSIPNPTRGGQRPQMIHNGPVRIRLAIAHPCTLCMDMGYHRTCPAQDGTWPNLATNNTTRAIEHIIDAVNRAIASSPHGPPFPRACVIDPHGHNFLQISDLPLAPQDGPSEVSVIHRGHGRTVRAYHHPDIRHLLQPGMTR